MLPVSSATMFSSSEYNPDSQPLCRVNGYPVYLTGILVAVHVISMVAGVLVSAASHTVSAASPDGLYRVAGWWGVLILQFPDTGQAAEVWRYVTYNFAQTPSVWFVVEMILLWIWGHQLEQLYGRKTFGRLYFGVVLVPALLAKAISIASPGLIFLLSGTTFSSFCVFLAFCFTHPGARFFYSVPWLTAKFVATCLFLIYVLRYLQDRDLVSLGLLVASCSLTYGILRRAGLSPRFSRLREIAAAALPSPRPRNVRAEQNPSSGARQRPAYRPKIAPRLDLPPEKQAVQEVTSLLDKIAQHGINSLTPEERAALERASAKLRDEE